MAAPASIPTPKPQLKNILLATDFSEGSSRALPFVGGISRAFRSTVHLCHIVAPTPLAAGAAAPGLYEAAGKEATQQLSALFHAPVLNGLERKLILAEGTIEDELLKVIREKSIDLVVAGTHGRTGWRRLLLGSVAETIYRFATCPVLTVGPALEPDGVLFERILFPTDLSDESKAILPYLTLLAQKYKSRLIVLHVLPEETGVNPEATALSESIRRDMVHTFEREPAPWNPEFILEFGDTVETVLRVAHEKKADLIAMGIRNAFTPGIQLRSSTAYRMIAGASCPVLTCR